MHDDTGGLRYFPPRSSQIPQRFGHHEPRVMALATAIATALPLGLATDLTSRIATSVINLVIGIAITTTLGAVGRTAIQRGR